MLCSITLIFSVAAANKVKDSTMVQATSVGVSKSTSSDSTTTNKNKKTKSETVRVNNQKKTDADQTLIAFILSLVSISFSVISIGTLIFVKKSSAKLENRIKDKIIEIDSKFERLDIELGKKINNGATQTKEDLTRYINDAITREFNVKQSSQPNKASYSVSDNGGVVEDEPKFVPKTFFGVYKQSSKGVKVDQTSSNKEGASTFEIITVSDDSAIYHIVDTLSKTQFASLNELALVEVVEGNPQSYSSISEEDPGEMKLYDDVWRIEKKVKIKLS